MQLKSWIDNQRKAHIKSIAYKIKIQIRMENLKQIGSIERNIARATVVAIKSFHRLDFEEDGDKGNPKRLRNFTCFALAAESVDYNAKLEYTNQSLTEGDLILICNILNLEYGGTKVDLAKRICNGLMNLDNLAEDVENQENEREELNADHEDENQEEEDDNRSTSVRNGQYKPKFMLSFRDFKDSIRPFSGNDNYNIDQWITEFEETQKLMQ